jgi:predicted TIM-barrel fold metal-dependent hydrolase
MPVPGFRVFDAHFHVVDPRFPLTPNRGFLPDRYTTSDYLERMKEYRLSGGVVVSGSFQAFDQDYLVDALSKLGETYVGVTQLPATSSDEEILELDEAGVRAVRFNLKRGGSEGVDRLDHLARRVHEIAGWHSELYVDNRELPDLLPILLALPAVCIDHLGLTREGLPALLTLVENGGRVKASGFGRVDFNVADILRDIFKVNPAALMFGTDLPSTRAARPYSDSDILLLVDALGEDEARRVCHDNAIRFYRIGNRD